MFFSEVSNTNMVITHNLFFFYNLALECDNAYEIGENSVNMFMSLEICCHYYKVRFLSCVEKASVKRLPLPQPYEVL